MSLSLPLWDKCFVVHSNFLSNHCSVDESVFLDIMIIDILSFALGHSLYTEHLYLPLGKQSPAWSKCLFLLGPICSLQGLLASGHPAIHVQDLSPWNLLYSHVPSLSLLSADRTVLVGIVCLRKCKTNISTFIPSCSPLMFTHLMGPVAISRRHINTCSPVLISFQFWKGVLLLGINVSYFNIPLAFPEWFSWGYAPYRNPFSRPVFHCPSAWPYGQAIRYFLWFNWNSNIGPKIMQFSPSSWFVFTFFNQSGGLPNRMLSLHLGIAIHKPSSSLLINRKLFIGHRPSGLSGHRIQQLLRCFRSRP